MLLAALCIGYFMVILDATGVTVALPAIGRDLGGGITGMQWVVDGYTVAFAAFLLSAGAVGDRLGSRRVLQAGLVTFTAASAACGLATGEPMLVAARVVQGLGAALVVPASLALLRAGYADTRARARAVGAWGAIASIAAAGGPIAGGALVTAVGWRAVFMVNVPVGVAGILLAARCLPAPPPRPAPIDPWGQVAAVATVALLCAGLIDAGATGWTAPFVVSACAASVLAAVAFVLCEHRSAAPMLPLRLFARREFSVGTAVGLLINLGFYGELFVLTLYFQQVRGDRPLVAGLAMLPLASVTILASSASGRAAGAIGPRLPMAAGLVCGTAGLGLLSLAGSETPYVLLVAPLVLAGAGMAVTMPAATAAVLEGAPGRQAGVAAGTINAARQVGGVIGVALLGTVVQAGDAASAGGVQAATILAAAAFAAGAAITLAAPGAGGRRCAPGW